MGMFQSTGFSARHALGAMDPIPFAGIMPAMRNRLKELRKASGLTQEQLGALSGLDQATVSKYERGGGNPTLETLELLARALSVEVGDLFPASASTEDARLIAGLASDLSEADRATLLSLAKRLHGAG